MIQNISSPDPDHPSLILCSLLDLNQTPPISLDSITEEIWERVLVSAIEQKMEAPLYYRLQDWFTKQAPRGGWFEKLHQKYLEESAASVIRIHQLGKILKSFQERDIPVIALKGAYLAESVYPDQISRSMVDMDLLVRKERLPAAVEALERLGYHPRKHFWIDYETRVSHEMPPFTKEEHFTVELHWTLIDPSIPFNIDIDGVWERAEKVSIAGRGILGLAPEDLVLHLCTHAATQHRLRGGLRNIYDIALTVKKFEPQLDWIILAQRAKEWGAGQTLRLMLSLAKRLFGATVADDWLNALGEKKVDPLLERIALALIFPEGPSGSSFSPWLASFNETRGLVPKIKFILTRIFVPRAEIARLYPVLPRSPLVYLYYPLHFVDMIAKHLRSAFRLFLREPETMAIAKSAYDQYSLENLLIERLTG